MSDIDIFAKTSSCVDIKNDVVSDINFEIMKAMKKANDSLADELAKYKKAFEILKEVLEIPEDDDIEFYVNDINYYKLKFTKRLINENEKKLLEELMKREEDK